MPFLLRTVALSAAILGSTALAGNFKSCPVSDNSPLSCHNSTAVKDTCCFNAPGGQLLQTQFWDTNPPTGPSDSFTVHGLWPDNCDGTYEANCDKKREYKNISDIIGKADPQLLDFMNKYWKDYQGNDETFWEHEWGKHGTCISTLEPSCYDGYEATQEVPDYFNRTVSLFQKLDSYQFLKKAGIVPSTSKTYTSQQILDALKTGHGATPAIQCQNGALDEVWYFFNVKGSVQSGDFEPSEPDGAKSNCPKSGVKWLPKGSDGGDGGSNSTSTSSKHHKPTPHPKPNFRNPHRPRWV